MIQYSYFVSEITCSPLFRQEAGGTGGRRQKSLRII